MTNPEVLQYVELSFLAHCRFTRDAESLSKFHIQYSTWEQLITIESEYQDG